MGLKGKHQKRLSEIVVQRSITSHISIKKKFEAPMIDFIEYKNRMNFKADWSRETSWAQWLIVYQDKNILKDFKGINKGYELRQQSPTCLTDPNPRP